MDNMIVVSDLQKRYGEFALKRVNLSVPEGCVVGLVGENGSGKTTLLRAILGLLRPDGGTVQLMGGDPACEVTRRDVAAVFEDSFFYGGLNARQVGHVMRETVQKWDQRRYEELLSVFGLQTDKPVKDYSTGMKMKINLATALARKPRLLILDEPTSGLDPVVRGQVLDILMEFMLDEKNAILISSHITSDLEQIADQIAYIHDGELVFQRDKLELMEDMAVVKCSADQIAALPGELVIARKDGVFGSAALVRQPKRVRELLPQAVLDTTSIDDMMRFYAGREER